MEHIEKKNYAPECEWTDITIQLAANKHNSSLPFIKIIIGHESSKLLHPSFWGLFIIMIKTRELVIRFVKLFGRHTSFTFDGHSSQRSSIEKRYNGSTTNLILISEVVWIRLYKITFRKLGVFY